MVLKMIMRDIVRDGIRTDNPAAEIKAINNLKKNEAAETIHRALSNEELEIFFKFAQNSLFCNFFKFMLYTGMRPGETAALQFQDIDTNKNCIHVRRTITYDLDNKIDEGSPKTYSSQRDVPLNSKTKELIKQQMEINQIIHGPVVPINGLIFPGKKGNMIRASSLDKGIERALNKANKAGYSISSFTAHSFRDTFATVCIEQGMQPHVLQRILGHKTIAMTMNLYYHLPEQTKQNEMLRISFVV